MRQVALDRGGVGLRRAPRHRYPDMVPGGRAPSPLLKVDQFAGKHQCDTGGETLTDYDLMGLNIHPEWWLPTVLVLAGLNIGDFVSVLIKAVMGRRSVSS
ncbi:hypothetical protein BRDID11004_70550 [Bradyrhizobium diazoefficiens]|uniref:Uncharacterized protein n=4 Tax=Bradyrhizobium TaxID=374 RepID=A0A809ZUT3_9BRAD|nr:hypothetical protein CF64_33930 [Bradyrhizobium japonicum]TWI61432.1 hypothetical protein IQ16_07121 [Bradyrhizobium huanghuaihaiense]BAL13533.1 hypothetical protein BJ6T_82900 [Bradyrhizobium japonicum USDA 6]BBZ91815.1 hypothetical protein F07S3_16480 [Bradyrhizobium diazoefficiens]BCA09800.1 hypothetical protein BDHF08_16470 [Bradyrhizobium diazoefficiens]